MAWQDRRILDLLGIEHPIILAPMAGASNAELVAAVSEAGGARQLRRRWHAAGSIA